MEKRGDKDRDAVLEAIAMKHLGFPTLKDRHSDEKDFREVSCWGVGYALREAYAAGIAMCNKDLEAALKARAESGGAS